MFSVLIHDYTLCFTDSLCCYFGYHNYISIWPYYIIIHFQNDEEVQKDGPSEQSPAWDILREDFMMGAKMKDWDKDSENEDNAAEQQHQDDSSDDDDDDTWSSR